MEQIKGKFSYGSDDLEKLLEKYYNEDEYIGFYTPKHEYVKVKLYQVKDEVRVKYMYGISGWLKVNVDWIAVVSCYGQQHVVGLEAYEWDLDGSTVDRNIIAMLAYSLIFSVGNNTIFDLYIPLDIEKISLTIEKEWQMQYN